MPLYHFTIFYESVRYIVTLRDFSFKKIQTVRNGANIFYRKDRIDRKVHVSLEIFYVCSPTRQPALPALLLSGGSTGGVFENDIPEYSRIIVASNYQIAQGKEEIYYTGYTNNEERIILFFRGYSLLDFNMIEIYTNAGKVRIDLKGKGIKEWISQ